MLSLIDTLGTLSPAGVRGALDQMSGALYGSVAQTDLQATTLELSFITRRIANGLSGVNQAPGGLATNSYGDRISPSTGSLSASDAGLTVRGQNGYGPFSPQPSNWTTWGFGYGLGGNAQGTSNAAGLNYSLGGTVVGLDMRDENHLLGVYAGYVGSHVGSYLSGQSVGVNGGQNGGLSAWRRRPELLHPAGRHGSRRLQLAAADEFWQRQHHRRGQLWRLAEPALPGGRRHAARIQGFDPALRRAQYLYAAKTASAKLARA